MSSHFHVDLGPFTIDVQLDDSGIRLQRGPRSETIPWEKISGATLLSTKIHSQEDAQEEERRAAQFLGPEAAQTIHTLRDRVGQIAIAYRDRNNHLREIDVPAPLYDPEFLQKFASRLGPRWLGESLDRRQAAKRLATNLGFFKSILILVVLFGMIAMVAGFGLLGLLGPILNLLSIQKMLLDLQDGDLVGFGTRFATYLGLFAIGYFLQRLIRSRYDSLKPRAIPPAIQKP
jgi:hypothetical protein